MSTAATSLESLWRCFDGIVPSTLATCSRDGIPNVSMLSHVSYVDPKHVALSRQFFNKTTRNLDENPEALLVMWDPITMGQHRLRLRYLRSETQGPLFSAMATRIQVIASHTGLKGVFRLICADVFEVLALEPPPEIAEPAAPNATSELIPAPTGIPREERSELWALQRVIERLRRANDLETVMSCLLRTLDEDLGFDHGMVLLYDEALGKLVTLSSHGYGEGGVGAEIGLGEGLIGIVAERRTPLRVAPLESALRYGRAFKASAQEGRSTDFSREIPLPGLAKPQSQMALPLLDEERLVGVLAFESERPHAFEAWHEVFLSVLADQFTQALVSALDKGESERPPERASPLPDPPGPLPELLTSPPEPTGPLPARTTPRVAEGSALPHHAFCLYRNDDCVFVDGEYLIRGVPARILWRVLLTHRNDGRSVFTNRELRLDPSLGLPPIRDNLESRLVLLRKRLEARCPALQIRSCGRGQFQLVIDCRYDLTERASTEIT